MRRRGDKEKKGGKDEEGQRMTGGERQRGEAISPSSNLVLLSKGSSRAHIPLGGKY